MTKKIVKDKPSKDKVSEKIENAASDAFADTGYNSRSTLDNPPLAQGEDDNEPESKSAARDFADLLTGERVFEVELSVTLKPVGGKSAKWPLLAMEERGTIVYDRLRAALELPENMKVVEAMLSNPVHRAKGKKNGQLSLA